MKGYLLSISILFHPIIILSSFRKLRNAEVVTLSFERIGAEKSEFIFKVKIITECSIFQGKKGMLNFSKMYFTIV